MKRILSFVFALLLTLSVSSIGVALAEEGETMYTHLRIRDDTMRYAEINVEYNMIQLEDRSTTHVEVGRLISISATPVTEVEKIYFKWDDNPTYKVESSLYKDNIPDFEIGSEHYLYVIALYKNGEYSEQKAFKFIIDERTSPADADDYWANLNELTYFENVYTVANIPINARLFLYGECPDGIAELSYKWDDGEKVVLEIAEGTSEDILRIPTEFEVGSVHKLTLGGKSRKNIDAVENTYCIRLVEKMEDFISIGIADDENVLYSLDNEEIKVQYGKSILLKSSAFKDNPKVKYNWWNLESSVEDEYIYFVMDCCHGEDNAHELHATAYSDELESMELKSQIYIYD